MNFCQVNLDFSSKATLVRLLYQNIFFHYHPNFCMKMNFFPCLILLDYMIITTTLLITIIARIALNKGYSSYIFIQKVMIDQLINWELDYSLELYLLMLDFQLSIYQFMTSNYHFQF